jgi:hypothetical protein
MGFAGTYTMLGNRVGWLKTGRIGSLRTAEGKIALRPYRSSNGVKPVELWDVVAYSSQSSHF